jgi:uncharacterized membrane protein (UPF0127 family)
MGAGRAAAQPAARAAGVGMYRIDAQVASTPLQRQIGLMHRKEMPQTEGMLFVFEQPGEQCFWMKNTLLPLTAAFVADDGTIVNLADMKPLTRAATARQAGALRAGDEPGLVRQAPRQGRAQAARQRVPAPLSLCYFQRKSRPKAAFLPMDADQAKFFPRSPS